MFVSLFPLYVKTGPSFITHILTFSPLGCQPHNFNVCARGIQPLNLKVK